MVFSMLFHERLDNLISESRLTHKQIEQRTGIAAGNISHYRNGKIKPSFDAIIELSKLFNVSLDYLILGKGEDSNNIISISDPDLEYMTLILKHMLDDPDPDMRSWVRRQFKYAFKDYLEEYEKKQHEISPESTSDAG